MQKIFSLGVLFIVLLALSAKLWSHPERPVVKAVLFYRPTCIHCHMVIEETLLPLVEKYGESLEVVLVNANTKEGQKLLEAMGRWYGLAEASPAVPTLLVSDHLLIGSTEINKQLPELVSEWTQRGGSKLPYVPGLQEILSGRVLPEDPEAQPVASGEEALSSVVNQGLWERIGQDPYGNSLAIALLVVMIASAAYLSTCWLRRSGEILARPAFALPFLMLVGLVITGYLTYVDLTGSEAVCGIGNCHAVQQSAFSHLFGIPVALIGLCGYLTLLAIWFWQRLAPFERAQRTAWLLPALAAFGLAFSIYLTFVEPFVIGFSCLWCLGSAACMTAILWMVSPLRPDRSNHPTSNILS